MDLKIKDYKIIVFAHDYVGEKVLEFIINNYLKDLVYVVIIDGNQRLFDFLVNLDFDTDKIFYNSSIYSEDFLEMINRNNISNIILAWWPKIIKEPILSLPKNGIINFHPSYLPYNRGKDANFWSIVEEVPFGVSLMIIDKSIDGGDIIYQKKIKKTWDDTGKTLYKKALDEIIKLFMENYENIRIGNYSKTKQKLSEGTFHYRKELEPKSEINLEKKYKARDLINLLRARTFPPHSSCYFFDEGEKYAIKIEISNIINKK